MNILLVGGPGSVINNLIIKLNKEGHRVFLITGSSDEKIPYQKVFERYNFAYDSNCIEEILESVKADVTIFMGAYDSNFAWKDDSAESVRYSRCMINILMGYARRGAGRFIYLSSDEVYSGDYPEDITEDMPVTPQGFRGITLAQAEEMCLNYWKNGGFDIVVLRLDHMYCVPNTLRDVTNICSKMCLEAMGKSIITLTSGNRLSLIYEFDAIEFIYRVVRSKEHKYPLYNISTSIELTELEVAEMVQAAYMGNVNMIESGKTPTRRILSNQRFDSEFKNPFFCHTQIIISRLVEKMKKDRRLFLDGEEKKPSLWKRITQKTGWFIKVIIPFLENLLLFIPAFMLNNRAVGSEYFANLDFYLLYVLLFAVVHGQQQATVSAVLAVIGYLFRQSYDRSGFEIMLDANTYVWIAQLFIVGLVVGYMRDSISKMKRESKEEADFLTTQLRDIHDINSSNVRVKDTLETQLINQNDSVGKIYSITSQLEQYNQDEVLFYAAEMVAKLMESKDVSIYVVSNATYARLFSATSPSARKMGNSIRYPELGEMYEELMERKVYINRRLDDSYPLMANAIFDDMDRMQMIIMVWNMPWERMTLGQANQLVVISALIQNAVVRANKYISALDEKRYMEGTPMLESETFISLVKAYIKAEKKGLTECVLLKVDIAEGQYKEAGRIISEKLRQSDYVGITVEGDVYVLLANTTKQDALFVIKRLKEIGYECTMVEGSIG